MNMSATGSIVDTRIKLRPNKALLALIDEHKDSISELPENLAKALKRNGYSVSSKIEVLKKEFTAEATKVDVELLQKLLGNIKDKEQVKEDKAKEQKTPKETSEEQQSEDEVKSDSEVVYLHLCDLRWLNVLLTQLRKEQKTQLYLHNIIEQCALELPQNEILERNPELEARCQKLREQQQNQQYRKMTKNVDAVLKNYPEDTIAYQMKAMNSQIIAVLQFVFSVVAGFVFGFLGVELLIGNLDFGFRLLLGIMCALIIALAEIYFLAKKLNEYDTVVDADPHSTPSKKQKVHSD